MRGCKRAHAAAQQSIQDRLCQRGTFSGVSTRAQLIKEHQVTVCDFTHDFHDVRHMRGERGQTLLNALLIADVSIHLLKYAQLSAKFSRHMQAALSHQREKAYSFQRDCFAARVRTGYDQSCKILPQPEIAWHDCFAGNKRMPCTLEPDTACFVHVREHTVHVAAELAFGKDQVQLCKQLGVAG